MSDEIIAFAELHGLEEKLHVLQKAGHLIEADTNHRDIPAITKAELYALETEHSRKWNQPLTMYLCILATALGAIGQGWAQASINGANLYYPQLFHVGSSSMHDTLVVGFINSGIYLSNGLLGSWLVAPLNSKLGRRGAVFTGALISLLFNVLGSSAPSWRRLLLCRLCLGVGLGIVSSSLNVFAAECAPAAIRGGLSVAWQMFVAFGIFLGFWANMLIDDHPESSGPLRWRYMLLAPAISNLPLLLLIFACPESPSWYIKHASQYRRAFTSLYRLRNTELQAARELLLTYFQRKEIGTRPETSLLRKLPELFTIPRNRRATVAAWSTNLAQQACGINIIAFFSSSIFVEAHFSNHAAELASTIFGLVNTIGALPAIWLMDAAGRRTLLLLTLPPMAVCMGIAGLSFSISEEKASLRFGMITSMIYLFCLLYSPGMGPVPPAYSAEVFPLSHRELGASSSMAITNIFAAILSLTFPWLLSTLGSTGSFLLYAFLNVAAWFLVFFLVPETKQKTLEELDDVFTVPTRKFVRERVDEAERWMGCCSGRGKQSGTEEDEEGRMQHYALLGDSP